MRFFIAILLEDSVINSLTKIQSDWKKLGMRGNFTPPQNLHLTLAFIGEFGSADLILDAMELVSFPKISVQLDGIGNFGNLYWVGISKNIFLANYVKLLRKSLSENKIPFDRKKFSPHITLVRQAEVNCSVGDLLKNSPREISVANEVCLMSSTRGKNGMIYKKVGSVESIENKNL